MIGPITVEELDKMCKFYKIEIGHKRDEYNQEICGIVEIKLENSKPVPIFLHITQQKCYFSRFRYDYSTNCAFTLVFNPNQIKLMDKELEFLFPSNCIMSKEAFAEFKEMVIKSYFTI